MEKITCFLSCNPLFCPVFGKIRLYLLKSAVLKNPPLLVKDILVFSEKSDKARLLSASYDGVIFTDGTLVALIFMENETSDTNKIKSPPRALPLPSAEILEALVKETKLESMKDMGRVMRLFREKAGPGVDGKTLAALAKERLS